MDNNIQLWWYEINGEKKGPVGNTEIQNLIYLKIIRLETYVWTNGFENWKAIRETEFLNNFKTKENPPPLTGNAVNNTIVWWLAFAPIIGTILEGIFIEIYYPEPDVDFENLSSINKYTDYLANTNFNAFWFVTLALNFLLSYLDEKNLQKSGHDTSTLGSTFLVPLYLFKRAEMLKQNNIYFWIWLIAFILTLL